LVYDQTKDSLIVTYLTTEPPTIASPLSPVVGNTTQYNREFPSLPKFNLAHLPNLSSLLKQKTFGEKIFPPSAVREHFRGRQSTVAKRGGYCRSLFLRGDVEAIPVSPIPIGVYTGLISSGLGVYHLQLPNVTIDGSPNSNIPMTCFGMMNEDIYENKYNVRINKDGTLQVISTIYPGDELLTKYDDEYDWEWLRPPVGLLLFYW
jgi:hypothetical protein